MQYSRPALAFKPLIPLLPNLYLLPLLPHHRLGSWLSFYASCFLPLTPSGFFNGMLVVFEPGALNCYIFFRLILLTLPVSRNPISTLLPLSGSMDSLRSDRTHSRSGILSRGATHASGGGVIIFVRQGLFSKLSTSSLSSLDPYSDYVEVNTFLNNSSSLPFLNVYAPHIRSSTDGRTDSFSPSILPPEISLFWGPSIAITPSRTPTPVGRKYWIGSSLLTSSSSMILTYLLFSIAPITITPPLTYPLLLSCSWEVLQDLGSDHLPILFLSPFCPNKRPFFSIFRKLAGMTLLLTLSLPFCRGIPVSFSFLCCPITSLALNAAPSSISFGRIKRQPKAWWSADGKDAVSKIRRADDLLFSLAQI